MFDAEPEGWVQTTLGAIAALGGGTTPSKSEEGYWVDGSVPWATPSDVTSLPNGESRISATEVTVAERALRECSLTLNPPGTVLMTSRATIGYAALNDVPMTTNQGFITFRCGDRTDPEFLLHWLTAKRDFLVAAAGGSTFKELSRGTAKLLPISLPPLDEQRRIADVLRSVDEAIAISASALDQSQVAVRAVLNELLGNPDADWATTRLGDVATFVNGRGFKPHEWGEVGLPIIRIQNLNGGTEFNYYSGEFNPKILIRPGDLLFAWSGSRGTSFGPHIWNGPEGVLNYHTWKVVPTQSEDRDFLFFALKHLTKKIEDEAHGASALVHMQKAFVVDYEIPLPPPQRRLEIGQMLSEMVSAVNAAKREYDRLASLKQHVTQDLLFGRVRVPA